MGSLGNNKCQALVDATLDIGLLTHAAKETGLALQLQPYVLECRL